MSNIIVLIPIILLFASNSFSLCGCLDSGETDSIQYGLLSNAINNNDAAIIKKVKETKNTYSVETFGDTIRFNFGNLSEYIFDSVNVKKHENIPDTVKVECRLNDFIETRNTGYTDIWKLLNTTMTSILCSCGEVGDIELGDRALMIINDNENYYSILPDSLFSMCRNYSESRQIYKLINDKVYYGKNDEKYMTIPKNILKHNKKLKTQQ